MITTALDGMGRCGLWSRPQRGQGEGKGAEEQAGVGNRVPFAYDREFIMAGDGAHVRVSLRSGTVLPRKVVGKTAHSPVQSDSPLRPQRSRSYTERQKQAGEERYVDKSTPVRVRCRLRYAMASQGNQSKSKRKQIRD